MADAQKVGGRFVDAFNAHDEGTIRELNGDSAVIEAPGDVRLEGRDAVTDYAMGWLRAFPDGRLAVRNEIAAGDWVVQEFTFHGTHENTLSSPAGDIPATHKRLNGRGVQILRVQGETVVDTRLYFDLVEVMTQLGVMPQPAAA
jgi:predicted ester cyclase